MLGKVVSSKLTFTKNNNELDPILVGLSKIQDNMGMPDLKRNETDNAVGDGNLWKKHFPELRKDVVKYIPRNSNLDFASINDNDYIYMSSSNTVHN